MKRMLAPEFESARSAAAFTLLEVLIAVAVFSIVLVAINSVFYGALRLRARVSEAVEDLTPTEHAVAIIKRDLLATLPAGSIMSGAMTTSPTMSGMGQQGGGLEFYTASGVVGEDEPWGDVQKVSFYLRSPIERTASTGKELMRAVTRNVLATIQDTPDEQLLLEDVEQIQFSFYDGSQWRQSWDENTTVASGTNQVTTPQAVQVVIHLAPHEKKVRVPIQFIVPITIQSFTNQTEETNSP